MLPLRKNPGYVPDIMVELMGVGMLVYAVNRASYYGLESFAVSNLNTGVIDIL